MRRTSGKGYVQKAAAFLLAALMSVSCMAPAVYAEEPAVTVQGSTYEEIAEPQTKLDAETEENLPAGQDISMGSLPEEQGAESASAGIDMVLNGGPGDLGIMTIEAATQADFNAQAKCLTPFNNASSDFWNADTTVQYRITVTNSGANLMSTATEAYFAAAMQKGTVQPKVDAGSVQVESGSISNYDTDDTHVYVRPVKSERNQVIFPANGKISFTVSFTVTEAEVSSKSFSFAVRFQKKGGQNFPQNATNKDFTFSSEHVDSTYTITLDPNGGSFLPHWSDKNQGDSGADKPVFWGGLFNTAKGYLHFYGNNVETENNAVITDNEDGTITLSALPDAEGGVIPLPDARALLYPTSGNHAGQQFVGWSTDPDTKFTAQDGLVSKDAKTYLPKNTFKHGEYSFDIYGTPDSRSEDLPTMPASDLTGDITLYAVWGPAIGLTLTVPDADIPHNDYKSLFSFDPTFGGRAPENENLFSMIEDDKIIESGTCDIELIGENGVTGLGAKKYVAFGRTFRTGDSITLPENSPILESGNIRFVAWYDKKAKQIALPGGTIQYGDTNTVYSVDALWLTCGDVEDVVVPYDGEEHSLADPSASIIGPESFDIGDEDGDIYVEKFQITVGGKTYDHMPSFRAAGKYRYDIKTNIQVKTNDGSTHTIPYFYQATLTILPVKNEYVVKLYGILEDATETKAAGLTFGPAFASDTDSGHTPGAGKKCLQDTSWDEIIRLASEDPEVFSECLEKGCTKSIHVPNPTGTIGADWLTGKYSYRRWNPTNTNEGGWPDSMIRNTLNGTATKNGSLSEEEAVISMLPENIRNAIVAKKVLSDTQYDDINGHTATTYDKLWLFSGVELSGEKDTYEDAFAADGRYRPNEGYPYTGHVRFNEENTEAWGDQHTYWLRSITDNRWGSQQTALIVSGYTYSTSYEHMDADKSKTDNNANDIAFGFCLGERPIEELKERYSVKYAVSVYGILQDTDESGNLIGLTFGPAAFNEGESYRSHDTSDGSVCIHDMTWEEIAEQASKDATVFQKCLENGCSHSVVLDMKGDPTGKKFTGQMDDGDGASVLTQSLSRTAKYGGFQEDDYLTAMPKAVQDAIVAKAITTDGEITAYDKLWLLSVSELCDASKTDGDWDDEFFGTNDGHLYAGSPFGSDRELTNEYGENNMFSALRTPDRTAFKGPDKYNNYWKVDSDRVDADDSNTGFGFSFCFCVGQTELRPEGDYNVKYAVQIYDLGEGEDRDGNVLSVTFGPAAGDSYISKSKSHVPSNDYYKCIHDMTWAQIVAQANTDPMVFWECMMNGCTHSVPMTLPTDLHGVDFYHTMDDGDGASVLLDSFARKSLWYGTLPLTGWESADIRTTLNGESKSVLSAVPDTLASGIVARKTLSDSVYDDIEENTATTYDKLWLFSRGQYFADAATAKPSDARPNEGTPLRRAFLFDTNLGSENSKLMDEYGAEQMAYFRSLRRSKDGEVYVLNKNGGCSGSKPDNDSRGLFFGFSVGTTDDIIIIFDANGGTFDNGARAVAKWEDDLVSENVFPAPKMAGKRVVGWVNVNDPDEQFTDVQDLDPDTAYYLKAVYADQIEVTFDAGEGGAVDVNTEREYTAALDDLDALPGADKDGYTFLGWFKSLEGADKVTLESLKADNVSVTVYAHWEKKQETQPTPTPEPTQPPQPGQTTDPASRPGSGGNTDQDTQQAAPAAGTLLPSRTGDAFHYGLYLAVFAASGLVLAGIVVYIVRKRKNR